jgi:hypothetical protein
MVYLSKICSAMAKMRRDRHDVAMTAQLQRRILGGLHSPQRRSPVLPYLATSCPRQHPDAQALAYLQPHPATLI